MGLDRFPALNWKNLTRQNGLDFLRLVPEIGIVTKTLTASPSSSSGGCFRSLDVARLALLGAACQQDYQRFAIAPEINPIPRRPINSVIEHPSDIGYAFGVRKIALSSGGQAVAQLKRAIRFSPDFRS